MRIMIGVGLIVGLASIASADRWADLFGGPGQSCKLTQEFSNRAAWSATVVRVPFWDRWSGRPGGEWYGPSNPTWYGRSGPEWFGVQREGERVRVHMIQGQARVREGRPVRLYPIRRDGFSEIAELRIPDLSFRTVGLVRYDARELQRERLWGYRGYVCEPTSYRLPPKHDVWPLKPGDRPPAYRPKWDWRKGWDEGPYGG